MSADARTPHPEPAARPGAGREVALALGLPGAGLVALVALMARRPDWLAALGAIQALYAAAFLCYATALWRLRRVATRPGAAAAVFAVALVARAVLLPGPPTLSDDLYRYAWEGRVILAGGNPYRQSPLDPALARLRDPRIFPAVNHPELATIYPPLAEAGFALVAAVSPTVSAFKTWVVLHDLALVALLMRLLARRGRAPAWVLVYAWNPLALVEYAGNGHNDPTAMAWLALALVLAERRPVAAGLALGVGALVKLAPLAAFPLVLRRAPWRGRLVALAVAGAGLAWFYAQTRGADSGLGAFWRSWRNNELLFHFFEGWTGSFTRARALAIALVVATLGIAWTRAAGPEGGTRAVFKAAVLAGPVAHPWYHGWWLMLEPLAPSAPWILLTLTAVLSYGVLAPPPGGHAFHLSLAGRAIEYGAPALLALGLAVARRARRTGPARVASPAPGGGL